MLKAGWVAYASFGKAVRLWNPGSGEERTQSPARPTSNLVTATDGTTLLYGVSHAIEFWNTATGRPQRTLRVPE